jgi:CheY-like chemotaxis protein
LFWEKSMSSSEQVISREQFVAQVSSAYRQLYDFVKLRRHPLAALLIADPSVSPKERGWQLHQLLLNRVDDLAPLPGTDIHSQEWRWHRILQRRYVDALTPQQVAEELALSRRQYFREQANALAAIADVLSTQCADRVNALQTDDPFQIIHDEAARLMRTDAQVNVSEVIEAISLMLANVLEMRGIQLRVERPEKAIIGALSKELLRQAVILLLGAVRGVAASQSVLTVSMRKVRDRVLLWIDGAGHPFEMEDVDNVVSMVNHLLQAANGHVELSTNRGVLERITITLPCEERRTLLVVDDNVELVSLFERLLTPNGYHIVSGPNSGELLQLACELRPYAIFMDLMMPHYDGWELLDQMVHQPATADIPVIICSVLKQRALAAALGAAAFLEKPITEAGLLAALHTIQPLGEA